MFRVGFAFRLKQVDKLIEMNPEKTCFTEERAALTGALEKLRANFCERRFRYCNTLYISIAEVW